MQVFECFHGTATVFDRFRKHSKSSHPSKIGIWFTECKETAGIIAKQAVRMCDDEPAIITAHIAISSSKSYETYADYLYDVAATGKGNSQNLRKKLVAQGYDSIEITNSNTDSGLLRRDIAVFYVENTEIISREVLDTEYALRF